MVGDDRLEALKKKLYERGRAVRSVRRSVLRNRAEDAQRTWDTAPAPRHSRVSAMAVLVAISGIFFIAAVSLAGYLLFLRPTNSAANVSLHIEGPHSLSGGDPVPLLISVVNQNPASLIHASLILEFPEGTREAPPNERVLTRERIDLGDIPSGAVLNRTVSVLFLGGEETPDVRASLEYRLPSGSTLFVETARYTPTLTAPSIDVAVSMPERIEPEQDFSIVVRVTSRASVPIEGLGLSVELPQGFSREGGRSRDEVGQNFWRIGTLEPTDEYSVNITGKIVGGGAGERGVRATVGIEDPAQAGRLARTFTNFFQRLAVATPAVELSTAINGSNAISITVQDEASVRVELRWRNGLDIPVVNGELTVALPVELLDPASVNAGDGFYNSGTQSIVWDYRTLTRMRELAPGARDQVSFSFRTRAPSGESSARSLPLTVRFHGTRVSGSGSTSVDALAERTFTLATRATFVADAFYSVGPLTNSGPIPPSVGRETSYTITWSLSNTFNTLEQAAIEAELPLSVRWMGATAPAGESIAFNPTTRVVRWEIGTVPALGAGARSASFQVGLTPSVSQIDDAPELIRESNLTAIDAESKTPLSLQRRAVTTKIVKDPAYRQGDERVVDAPASGE